MRTLWRLIASFFKWTWRILNFIRKLALNAIFLVLVLVCIGIWSQFSSTTSEHAARGALLLDITGVARAFYAMTYSPFIPFLMAAALYLLCTFLLIFTFARAERRWLAFIRRG